MVMALVDVVLFCFVAIDFVLYQSLPDLLFLSPSVLCMTARKCGFTQFRNIAQHWQLKHIMLLQQLVVLKRKLAISMDYILQEIWNKESVSCLHMLLESVVAQII